MNMHSSGLITIEDNLFSSIEKTVVYKKKYFLEFGFIWLEMACAEFRSFCASNQIHLSRGVVAPADDAQVDRVLHAFPALFVHLRGNRLHPSD